VLRDFRVTRIDVTFSYSLDSVERVREWIRAAGECFRHKHQKAKVYGEQTLMVGMVGDGVNQVDTGKLKGSRRSMLKIYCKGDEVKIKDFITRFGKERGKKLHAEAQGLLRVEVVLRGMYLTDKGLKKFSDFSEEKLMRIYKERVMSLELPANKELTENHLDHLSVKLRGVYELWSSGKDLRRMFAKSTLSRYAKAMLEYGIDIYAPPRNVKRTNVIPMYRVLEAVPWQLSDELSHLVYSPNRYTIDMLAA
jgi:II/X family phage/plasmid replication protein